MTVPIPAAGPDAAPESLIRYESDRIGIASIEKFIAYVESDPDMGTEDLVRIGSAVKPLGDWRYYIATYPRMPGKVRQG